MNLLFPGSIGQRIGAGPLDRHIAMAWSEFVGLPPIAALRPHELDHGHVVLELRIAGAFAGTHRGILVDPVELEKLARIRTEQLHVIVKRLAGTTGPGRDGRAQKRLRERGAEARERDSHGCKKGAHRSGSSCRDYMFNVPHTSS